MNHVHSLDLMIKAKDECIKLKCNIIGVQDKYSHTEYEIEVQNCASEEKPWSISRRYKEFLQLFNTIDASSLGYTIPGKKIIGSMNKSVIDERIKELNKLMNDIVSDVRISNLTFVHDFLNYEQSVECEDYKIFNLCLLSLRNSDIWKSPRLLKISWRRTKKYFLTEDQSSNKKFIIKWVAFGTDCSENSMCNTMKLFKSIEHANIIKFHSYEIFPDGVRIINNYLQEGSLFDKIYGISDITSPLETKLKDKKFTPIDPSICLKWIYMILEAVQVLHGSGLAHGHLHVGNLFIVDDTIRISDFENIALGLTMKNRLFLMNINSIRTMANIDVYSIGHIIYEICTGQQLNTPFIDSKSLENLPKLITPILEQILIEDSVNSNMPDVTTLIKMKIFDKFRTNSQLITLKIPDPIMASFREQEMALIERIRYDHKKITIYEQFSIARKDLINKKGLKLIAMVNN